MGPGCRRVAGDGRSKGKDPTGKAKTREAKLGCVFTQDQGGRGGLSLRDPESTTYVERSNSRGVWPTDLCRGRTPRSDASGEGRRARRRSTLDLGIAEEHFPGAIQIVDLYHAREHLVSLAKIAYEMGSVRWKQWLAARVKQLDAGEIESLVISLRRLRSQGGTVRDPTDKAIDYFQTNRQRMRYADFRRQGLFVGSGVIEAGCKTTLDNDSSAPECTGTVRGANGHHRAALLPDDGRWE